MNSLDLLIRGGQVVTESGVIRADIGIAAETIVEISPSISAKAKNLINADGLHVFPGVIDSHVHFNEPGRADWEGIATGSRAVAAGGGTLFFDMPLNAHPPTIDAASFAEKRALTEQKSVVDFALWGGLVPSNIDEMESLAECGVIGFKAFMSNSGIEDFSSVDDAVLRAGMKRAAALRLLVAVHAESDIITAQLSKLARDENRTGIRDYLNSRPISAEIDAIRRAIDIAAETSCALHIVHVSSSAGVQLVSAAREHGIDVTCETCPHYLVLTDEDVEILGAVAKCAPPLRPESERLLLLKELNCGNIATVGSDHSPAPPSMKQSTDFFKVWGGISGAQHVLSLLITLGLNFPLISSVTAKNVADRFRLPKKGGIEIGNDADLALIDLNFSQSIRQEHLHYLHRQSPYIGRKLACKVKQTFVRGQVVYADGHHAPTFSARLIKPLEN